MKKSILVSVLCLFISAGHVFSMSAVEYNNIIIGEQGKITARMVGMAEFFGSSAEKSEKKRLELVKQCKSSLKVVKKLPAFNGNTRFRDGAADLFSFYAQITNKEFKEMIAILKKGSSDTTADVDRLTVLEKEISKKEGPLDEAFQAAQTAFAKENNFELNENSMQKEIDNLGK